MGKLLKHQNECKQTRKFLLFLLSSRGSFYSFADDVALDVDETFAI